MTQPAREPAPHPDGHRPPSDQAVYGISVASELTGCTPETLRLYERRKLLAPARTDGGTRRYTNDDINRIRRIAELSASGINLTGIAHILSLESANLELCNQLNDQAGRRSR